MKLPLPAVCVIASMSFVAVACGGASAPPQGPAAPAGGAPAAASTPRFTSETTPLYPREECKTLIPGEDGSDPTLGCPALPGYEVVIQFTAWATHVRIDGPETQVSFSGYVGDELEWRLADGKPFAVIASVIGDEERERDPNAAVLQVRGIAGWPIEANVPITVKNAAQAARDMADAGYHGKPQEQAPPP
jgi:hypothetical protein